MNQDQLREALEQAKIKLHLYRQHHSGVYVGGMEYMALIRIIDAALTATQQAAPSQGAGELPALPVCTHSVPYPGAKEDFFYTVDQMHAYARAALLEASAQQGEIVITKTEAGQIVAVTRQDEEGRILEVIAEASAQREQPAASKPDYGDCEMGQMCLNCQPRGPNGECPDASKPAPQAQAGEPEVIARVENVARTVGSEVKTPTLVLIKDVPTGAELITLKSHREAMAVATNRYTTAEYLLDAALEAIAKKDAALKAQNEALEATGIKWPQVVAAITQGQEAMK